MSEHTKEPWAATHTGVRIEGANYGRMICDCDGPDALANARRIVACVNACKGIDTKFLEEALLAGEEPALYAHTLMQQRDELLELSKLVRKELVAFADYLKCSTVGREWATDAHYDRVTALAAKLAEKVKATP